MPSVSFHRVRVPAAPDGRNDHDLEFSVQDGTGTVVGVLGERGSGAELILDLLCGRVSAAAGTITIDGQSLQGSARMAEVESDAASLPEHLTVEEVLSRASLIAGRSSPRATHDLMARLGLDQVRAVRVAALDPLHQRLVSIAAAFVHCPRVLVCRQLSAGLDGGERERLWKRVRDVAGALGCTVFQLAREVDLLRHCDSVLVLRDGRVIYHAPPQALAHYFGIGEDSSLFARLDERPAIQWMRSWERHRESYQKAFSAGPPPPAARPEDTDADPDGGASAGPAALPHGTAVRVAARLALDHVRRLARSRQALGRAAAVPLAFLPIVAVFSRHGRVPSMESAPPSEAAGASLSLFVLLVVIAAILAGARNGIREIAGEREIFRRERALGLSPGVYILAKATVLAALAAVQSLWMLTVVLVLCRLPAAPVTVGGLLLLANLAGGALALALSAASPSVLVASRCGAYFVGTQVLLSGSLLALPRGIAFVTRPFVTSFWGWSGILHRCAERFAFFAADGAPHPTAPPALCAATLGSQALAGVLLAFLLVRRIAPPCRNQPGPGTARRGRGSRQQMP